MQYLRELQQEYPAPRWLSNAMMFTMSKLMVTLLRHTLCRDPSYFRKGVDREKGWGYPCDRNGWVTFDTLKAMWTSPQANVCQQCRRHELDCLGTPMN